MSMTNCNQQQFSELQCKTTTQPLPVVSQPKWSCLAARQWPIYFSFAMVCVKASLYLLLQDSDQGSTVCTMQQLLLSLPTDIHCTNPCRIYLDWSLQSRKHFLSHCIISLPQLNLLHFYSVIIFLEAFLFMTNMTQEKMLTFSLLYVFIMIGPVKDVVICMHMHENPGHIY